MACYDQAYIGPTEMTKTHIEISGAIRSSRVIKQNSKLVMKSRNTPKRYRMHLEKSKLLSARTNERLETNCFKLGLCECVQEWSRSTLSDQSSWQEVAGKYCARLQDDNLLRPGSVATDPLPVNRRNARVRSITNCECSRTMPTGLIISCRSDGPNTRDSTVGCSTMFH